jgi:protoheme IX farnesyltransferase
VAVTLVASLLAVATGRPAGGVAAVAVAVLATQLCVGWSNDWLDAGRDALAGRRDKPVAAGAVSRRTVGAAALLAGVAAVPLTLLSGWRAGALCCLGLVFGLAYNWPLKFTALSPLPYLVSFGCLAAFVALGRAPQPGRSHGVPWWLVVGAALLGGGAHFLNALPDLAHDLRTGVRGLPHLLGTGGSWLAGGALLAAATLVLALGPPGPPSWAAVGIVLAVLLLLPIGWYASRTAGSRAAFRAVMLIALADVVLLMLAGTAL